MQLTINPYVKSIYPDLKVSIMEIKLTSKIDFDQGLIKLKKELENKIRNDYKNPEILEKVIKYNSFYKKFDSKVPMEFQIKSILNNKEIQRINPIITSMFMAELKNIMLTAGHDLDKLGKKIEVLCSDGNEEYTKINEKSQKLKRNDIFATDGAGIISSVLYGPDFRTKIIDETRNCIFMCYCPFKISDNEIREHMLDILNYLRISGKNSLEAGDIQICASYAEADVS